MSSGLPEKLLDHLADPCDTYSMPADKLSARWKKITEAAVAQERRRFPDETPHPADVLASAYDLAGDVLLVDEVADQIEAYAAELLATEPLKPLEIPAGANCMRIDIVENRRQKGLGAAW